MDEIYNKNQQDLAKKMENNPSLKKWTNWRWQLKHSIKKLETFEKLTGISFSKKDRDQFAETTSKFPMSITPYYLSLIDTKDYKSDPIFKQAFPDPSELKIQRADMA